MNADWLMTDTVEILRPTRTDDEIGGKSTTWTSLGTLQCRVNPRMPRLTFKAPYVAEEQTEYALRIVYFPPGSDVKRNDHVIHSTGTFSVLNTTDPSEPAYLRSDCIDIEAGS